MATTPTNYAQLAQQFAPGSADYQTLMNFAKDPSQVNVGTNAAMLQSILGSPAMPVITDSSGAQVPYNAPALPGQSYTQLSPGSAGIAAAPAGSIIDAATLAPSAWAAGAADQAQPGTQPVGPLAGAPIPGTADQPQPGDQPVGPLAAGGNADTGVSGGGSSDGSAGSDAPGPNNNGTSTDTPSTGGLTSILGSIFGSNGATSLPSLLSSIIPIGSALWQYLGTQGAFNQAGNLINAAELNAGSQVDNAAQGAGQGVVSAADSAASGVKSATGDANDLLQSLYGSTTGLQTPYQATGVTATNELASGLQPGGDLNSNLTADQVLANDPGYQFRLGQGEGDLQARLAAEGLSGSGEAGKQLSQFQQDFASNEFQNAFQRQQQQEQALYSRLAGAAGLGENANAQDLTAAETLGAPQSSNVMTAGEYGGNARQTAAENSGLFNVQGSQYQGNANVTGASAQAGALIDANQQKNAMIQQIMTSLLSLFNRNNTNGSTVNVGSGSGGLVVQP